MRKPNRHIRQALYTALALVMAGVVLYTFYTLPKPAELLAAVGQILRPPAWGIAIAYILAQPAAFFEKKVFRVTSATPARGAKSVKFRRGAALACTVVSSAGVAVLIIGLCLPQLVDSFTGLVEKLPRYISALDDLAQRNFSIVLFDKSVAENFNLTSVLGNIFPSGNRGEQISQVASVVTTLVSPALKNV